MLVGDLLSRRAAIVPQAPYWRQGGALWSYGQMEARANRLGHALLAQPLAPQAPVGLFSAVTPQYPALFFGAAKAGRLLAHFNARLTGGELAALLRHSQAGALFFHPRQAPAADEARQALAQPAGGPGPVGLWVCLEEPCPPWATPLEEWLEGHPDNPPPAPEQGPESPFQLLYTSGTTGQPKGALISHGAKLRLGATHQENIGLEADSVILSALPLYHHFGQWLNFIAAPLAGAQVVAQESFAPAAVWAALAQSGATHLPAVPTMLRRLLAEEPAGQPPLPALRQIVYGGEAAGETLVRALRSRFVGVRLFQGFGLTEAGYLLGLHDTDHGLHPDCLGRPDKYSQIMLLDERGREVERGQVGELTARTPYLMNGYLNDPEATARFFSHGKNWGRTGDLAWQDEEGYYHLAGRADDMIVTGGVNLYPAETEQTLAAHPAVAAAALLGVESPQWGQMAVAAIQTRQAPPAGGPAAQTLANDLDGWCRQRLAPFKRPKQYAFYTALPTTPSGKVRRAALRDGWNPAQALAPAPAD